MVPSAPKHNEMPQNMEWIGWICCKKFYTTLWLELLHLLQQFVPFSTEYRKATERSQMHPNTTEANKSLGSNGVDRVHSLLKIQTRLRGMKFCIICTNSAYFAPSFMQQRNDPKCTQTLQNAQKHEFRVQWGGSSLFIVKNSDTTSWHKLSH